MASDERTSAAAEIPERDDFPPCPKHGEGFICDHEKGVDYADEWD